MIVSWQQTWWVITLYSIHVFPTIYWLKRWKFRNRIQNLLTLIMVSPLLMTETRLLFTQGHGMMTTTHLSAKGLHVIPTVRMLRLYSPLLELPFAGMARGIPILARQKFIWTMNWKQQLMRMGPQKQAYVFLKRLIFRLPSIPLKLCARAEWLILTALHMKLLPLNPSMKRSMRSRIGSLMLGIGKSITTASSTWETQCAQTKPALMLNWLSVVQPYACMQRWASILALQMSI